MRHKVLSVTAADCELQTFRSGGNGGQNQNTRDTGVRWVHGPSGARGEARDERSQLQNKRLAWRRMCASKEFQLWLRRTLGQGAAREAEEEMTRLRQEAYVNRSMVTENLRIEVKVGGKWAEVQEADLAS